MSNISSKFFLSFSFLGDEVYGAGILGISTKIKEIKKKENKKKIEFCDGIINTKQVRETLDT